jgi:hypothetical protein
MSEDALSNLPCLQAKEMRDRKTIMIVKLAAPFANSAFRAAITFAVIAFLLPTDSFAESQPLRPLTAAEIKATPTKNAKPRSSVRDHLNLKPLTAAEIKAGLPKNTKASSSVRDHLNLRPLTAEEIKHERNH